MTVRHRPAGRKRRVFGISTTSAAITVVVVLSAWLLFGFSASAHRNHDVALTASRLDAAIEELDGTAARVTDASALTPALEAKLRVHEIEAGRQLGVLHGDSVVAKRVAPVYRSYRLALDKELD